jgi:hypothetical protein
MIDETLRKIEARLRDADGIPDERKKELLGLLATLADEVSGLSETRREHAQSIAGFAERSAYEATRREKDEALLDLSVQALGSSVRQFEATHPRLVDIVNQICNQLSNLGI